MSEATTGTSDPQPAPTNGVRLRIFGRTDVGMVREHNEDNFLIVDLSQAIRTVRPEVRTHIVGARGTMFAVCDGMGGAAAGEVASQMAIDTIHDLVQNGPAPENRDQFAQRLSAAINEAGARIFLAAKSNRSQRGMGTTSTVAGVYGKTLFVGQVGDSRAYMVRSGRIKQITKDQSLVSKLIEAGQLTEAEAESYEHSHIILQALGTADTVSVDLSFMDLCAGDCFMLCSDGLSGLVTSEQMREVLTTIDEPMDCCKRLTEIANQAGGHDNITVIVARFDGDVPPVTGDAEIFGYQPYVIDHPIEAPAAARASGKIKGADSPPPGKDVKYAVSIRPPAMNGAAPEAMRPAAASGEAYPAAADDDDIRLPVSNTPRTVLAVCLILVALGIIAVAARMLMKREPSDTENSAAITVASQSPAIVQLADASAMATPIALPSAASPDATDPVVPVVAAPSGTVADAGSTAPAPAAPSQ